MQQTSNTLVLSLIGLNNTSNKKQVSKSQFSTSQTNSCGRRRHSATQSTVFATASRISAIFRILLSLCSLHKNTGVNYFYFPGLVTSAVDRSRGRGTPPPHTLPHLASSAPQLALRLRRSTLVPSPTSTPGSAYALFAVAHTGVMSAIYYDVVVRSCFFRS